MDTDTETILTHFLDLFLTSFKTRFQLQWLSSNEQDEKTIMNGA